VKILIYGTGVLGSLYAYRLQSAGQDVTVLARGQRLADLRQYGLVLEDMVTGQRVETKVRVCDRLAPEEAFDLALAIMGKHQIASVLPALAANPNIPNVLFMGNNAAGPDEMIAALGRERVLLGFPLAGGTLEGHIVRYAAGNDRTPARAVIGEVDGTNSPRLQEIAAVLESAGFSTSLSPNMDAWLKTHAAAILPLGAAYFAAGLEPLRLSRTRDALVLTVRAIREGFRVLRARGIPILPARQKIFAILPEGLLVTMFARMLHSKEYQYALAHAPHMRPELQRLAADFKELARTTTISMPALDKLCTYLEPAFPPMPDGSVQIQMGW